MDSDFYWILNATRGSRAAPRRSTLQAFPDSKSYSTIRRMSRYQVKKVWMYLPATQWTFHSGYKMWVLSQFLMGSSVQRQKFAGGNCEQETEEQKAISISQFDNPQNVRTCILRKFLTHIENTCNCSMRNFYDPKPNGKFLRLILVVIWSLI